MATGGGDIVFDDPALDNWLDHNDDDDDEEKEDKQEQEQNRLQPFKPGTASTPYHGVEEIEMQARQHKKTGLPDTSYDEETPFLRRAGSITNLQNESALRQKLKKTRLYEGQIPPSRFSKK